jgi:hypothetical protein
MIPLPWRLFVRNRGQDYDKEFEFKENADYYVRNSCVGKPHGFYLAYLYEKIEGNEIYRGEYDRTGVFTPAD